MVNDPYRINNKVERYWKETGGLACIEVCETLYVCSGKLDPRYGFVMEVNISELE